MKVDMSQKHMNVKKSKYTTITYSHICFDTTVGSVWKIITVDWRLDIMDEVAWIQASLEDKRV